MGAALRSPRSVLRGVRPERVAQRAQQRLEPVELARRQQLGPLLAQLGDDRARVALDGEMIEAGFGLANSGRTSAQGMPGPLWLAGLAREYRDVLRFTRPPALLQAILFIPLAALARASGRDPAAAWLHGAGSPARIPTPDDAPAPAIAAVAAA